MNEVRRRSVLLVLIAVTASLVRTRADDGSSKTYRIMPAGDSITEGGSSFSNYRYPLLRKLTAAGYRVQYVGSRSSQSPAGPLAHEGYGGRNADGADIRDDFQNPPDSARPGVYWYFMDGNLNREEMVKDLESMKKVGLGNLVFLEVNIGVPRGPVDFMSDSWQELFAHAVHHAERLGIDITLGAGPGWTGSGGPWVTAEQSMQHLVFSTVETNGPGRFDDVLPIPAQRSTRWHQMRSPFYEDVAVYAFPTCTSVIHDIDEKALYERNPYTSMPGVKPYLPAPADYPELDESSVIAPTQLIDLTGHLEPDGRLDWDVPSGEWTILRMGRRSTGASTRPAPEPGIGFDHDKFDKVALNDHFANYYGKLLERVGPRAAEHGWTTIHLDSWEMGAQNWTPTFCEEFKRRRGYDPRPYLVTFSGRAVQSVEASERFLWDVRLTAQELVLENYAGHLKTLGHKHGFELSIEPYDMNPTADLDLGAVADVPMCEFWGAGFGFDSSFSCIESTSIAHTTGRRIVSAEAFTGRDQWQQYPWSMKNQGDWAFCIGINRFVYHTFAHKPLGDAYRPGMTMGPYGVHWDRGQTWWPMVLDYHRYVARCSHLLRQGVTVSDILYLTPEGAPHVFRPPPSALQGEAPLADKRGYAFDGCSPNTLMAHAEVQDGRIVFPGGTSYRVLVLPRFETMTPGLLETIIQLVEAGAVVYGAPPAASPSLSGYPQCDANVQELAERLWGETPVPMRQVGQGRILLDQFVSSDTEDNVPPALYPDYATTAAVLAEMGVPEDFRCAAQADGSIRFTHRETDREDIYFLANTTKMPLETTCRFRVKEGWPQLWDPVTAAIRPLPQFTHDENVTSVPMSFEPHQSFFVIFPRGGEPNRASDEHDVNFPKTAPVATLKGSWQVSFDPKWGGPEKITFDALQDWTEHAQRGIKYYSGIAVYRKSFDRPRPSDTKIYLDLGTVHNMARIKLNGRDLGVVWCAPWRVEITDAVQSGINQLEIQVANRWPNRLLGDRQSPDKDVRTVKWDSGLLGGAEYKAGRYTFTTGKGPGELLPSGLLGPVTLNVESAR